MLTIDVLALGHVGVVATREKAIPVTADDTLNVAGSRSSAEWITQGGYFGFVPIVYVEVETLHLWRKWLRY